MAVVGFSRVGGYEALKHSPPPSVSQDEWSRFFRLYRPPDDPDYPANWGPMRVPKGTPVPAKLDMTCAQTLHANLYPTLAKRGFDVFMLITTLPSNTGQKHNLRKHNLRMVKPGDLSACDPLRPTDSTNELFCRVEVADPARSLFPLA